MGAPLLSAVRKKDEEEEFPANECGPSPSVAVTPVNICIISGISERFESHDPWKMSSRALRRLRGKQRGQEALDPADLTLSDRSEEQAAEAEGEEPDTANPSGRKAKKNKNKSQKNLSNIYELVKWRKQHAHLHV